MNKESLLNIIDHYKYYFKSKHDKPGWTSWTLIAAIGSLIWYNLRVYNSNPVDLVNIVKYFLFFFIINNFFISLVKIFNNVTYQNTNNRFQFLCDLINKRVRYLSFLGAIELVIIIISIYYFKQNKVFITIFLILMIPSVISLIFTIIIRYKKFPIVLGGKEGKNVIIGTIIYFILWLTLTIIYFKNNIYKDFSLFNLIYHMPIYLTYILIREYIKIYSANTEITFIDNLYNDVLFCKNLKEKDVINKLEVLVLGYNTNQIIEYFINDFENIILELYCDIEELGKFKSYLKSEKDSTKKKGYHFAIEQQDIIIKNKLGQLEKMINKMSFAMKFMKYNITYKPIIDEIYNRLKNDIVDFKEKIKNIEKE